MTDKKRTTLLLILDGWGIAPEDYPADQNAIALANTPHWDDMVKRWPMTKIDTSGPAVGLVEGIMGNSEVGHLNLGAGRVVWQAIKRIDNAIDDDGLASNEALNRAIQRALDNESTLHLMGLLGDGGVHSIDRHMFAVLRLAKQKGLPGDRVVIHSYTDGRDTPPKQGIEFMERLEKTLEDESLGRVGTVSGRYYAMDRDKRWERTKKAWDAVVHDRAEYSASSGQDAIRQAYERDETDEFITPTVIEGADNGIHDGDAVIFTNFRPDRARQLSHALADDDFDAFDRGGHPDIVLTTMTRYENNLNSEVAFPPRDVSNTLGEVVSNAGMTQLRLAETEKYAHVTYFFSGGREEPFEGESRIMIPSPKVATYDLQPEMSLPEVSDELVAAIEGGTYDLIVCNFANGDMVGHTGDLDAARKAAEAVDAALGKVIPALLAAHGRAIVTADHGNAEIMWNYEDNCPHTQHTTTRTFAMLVDEERKSATLASGGKLGDIAPTLLALMGGPKPPAEMDGNNLLGD